MATGLPARNLGFQVTQYLRTPITFTNLGTVSIVNLGTLPAGSVVLRCGVVLSVVFNWGTNYSKQLGQDTEDDYFVPTLASSRNLDARDCYSVSVGGQHSLLIVSDEKDKEDSDESM